MNTIQLIRTQTSDQGTRGQILIEGQKPFYTGELPWRNNIPSMSSIPKGAFPVKMLWSEKHQRKVYHVLGVQGRDQNNKMANIEIHSGNYYGDTTKFLSDGKTRLKSDVLGCILLGNGLLVPNNGGQEQLTDSRSAVARFESLMKGEDFMLSIVEKYS